MRLASIAVAFTILSGAAWCEAAPNVSMARSHSTQVDILNIDQEQLVGQISDTPGVHQIALAPDFGRGFTSNGKDSA